MTIPTQGTWDAASELVLYPDADAEAKLRAACLELEAVKGPLARAAADFRRFVETTDATRREEMFTTVFDINPTCTLELGWHLYGEDYKRGSFLVDMRQVMAAVGVEESAELPDHLIHALRVLQRLPAPKDALFSTSFVQPGLDRMLSGYSDESSPWRPVLAALLSALEACYGETKTAEGIPAAESPGPYEPAPSCSSLGSNRE